MTEALAATEVLLMSRIPATVDKFRSPHLWERRDGEWLLEHAVWKSE